MLSVTTKTGDAGKSSLANGKRVSKSDLSFEVIGTLDELNSHLGKVVSQFRPHASHEELKDSFLFLQKIQKQLFVLGGYVAHAGSKLSEDFLKKLEENTNFVQQKMAEDWHSRFVLPGGHDLAAELDIARTVCRRLERRCVEYSEGQEVNPLFLQTVNRLSDYLYVLRCFVNETLGVEEHYI